MTRGTPIASFTERPAGYVVEKADIDRGWTRPLPEEAFAYGYQAEMRHFVECVRDGAPPRETYEDGLVVNLHPRRRLSLDEDGKVGTGQVLKTAP